MALSTQSLFSEENNNQSIEYTVAAWLMSLPMDKHIHVSGVEVWVQSGIKTPNSEIVLSLALHYTSVFTPLRRLSEWNTGALGQVSDFVLGLISMGPYWWTDWALWTRALRYSISSFSSSAAFRACLSLFSCSLTCSLWCFSASYTARCSWRISEWRTKLLTSVRGWEDLRGTNGFW